MLSHRPYSALFLAHQLGCLDLSEVPVTNEEVVLLMIVEFMDRLLSLFL